MIVGYLGPEGTYTEQAVDDFLRVRDEKAKKAPFLSIKEIFQSLKDKRFDAAVLPLHNTLAGDYGDTVRGLEEGNFITLDTLELKIEICAGIHPQSGKSKIMEVRSRDTALRECSQYLGREFPRIKKVEVDSTALTMREIMQEGLMHVMAVGSEFGMNKYGLNIVDRNIENNSNNYTRFIYITLK
ncbi:MAG: prephenate dehydratase domain-containing protein [Nanoarchaeota archaeon]|nr:prephenate dehydratase domain-containing protein [Nanoarchaeota archaeon]